MVKLLLVVTAVVVLSVPAASQTQRKQLAIRQTERDLIALSQKAVGTVGSLDVNPDTFTGTMTVLRTCNTAELVDPHITISGERAVVTGLVAFKCASSAPHAKEPSSTVAIEFIKRDGTWRFAELCLGACGE